MKGLKRLEYRGYDSAGVAFDDDVSIDLQGESVLKTRSVGMGEVKGEKISLIITILYGYNLSAF